MTKALTKEERAAIIAALLDTRKCEEMTDEELMTIIKLAQFHG
jgi:hypothetical protein